MLDRNIHKTVLLQILKDIYTDTSLGPILGFKGGTAANFFYDLGRFSVDLDFDLLKEDKEAFVFEKIEKILHEFSTPNTCVTGFNNIRFDDEFTRFGFYRLLLDPYTREWQHGNSRWDIIDLVRATGALRRDGIEWPRTSSAPPPRAGHPFRQRSSPGTAPGYRSIGRRATRRRNGRSRRAWYSAASRRSARRREC